MRISIVVSSKIYVRNYIQSGVIKTLSEKNNVSVIIAEDISIPNDCNISNVSVYKRNKLQEKSKERVFNSLMYKYNNKSSSFRFRLDRSKIFQKEELTMAITLRNYCGLVFRAFNRALNRFFYLCISNLSEKTIISIFGAHSVNMSLKHLLIETSPEIVIMPSSAYSAEDIDVAIICKDLNIPSLMLVDNWDNISSKSILWEKPTYVAVWGKQSAEQANKIQGFNSNQIFVLGTARFSHYFEQRNLSLKSHFDFKYILFVGTALYFNEFDALKILNKEINKNKNIYHDLKIVYRPHPWRQRYEGIDISNLQSVIIDPQLNEVYSNKKYNISFQPDLCYYPSLIQNAEFLVGGMTSMFIESQIFYKKYIGLIHRESGINSSPDQVFKRYEHFHGIDKFPTLLLCENLNELPNCFRATFLDKRQQNKSEIDKIRNYFLFNDDTPYSQKLQGIINQIVLKSHSPVNLHT